MQADFTIAQSLFRLLAFIDVPKWNGKPSSSGEETRISFDDFVIIGVAAYPEPQQTFRYLNSKRPKMQPYAD